MVLMVTKFVTFWLSAVHHILTGLTHQLLVYGSIWYNYDSRIISKLYWGDSIRHHVKKEKIRSTFIMVLTWSWLHTVLQEFVAVSIFSCLWPKQICHNCTIIHINIYPSSILYMARFVFSQSPISYLYQLKLHHILSPIYSCMDKLKAGVQK